MLKSLTAAAVLLAGLAAAPLAQAATVTVNITNYTFVPAKVTVHPGDKVTWTNQDSIPHTATALDGKSFDSGTIDPNASWSFTFTKAGVYKYRCAIHPDMQGEVDVQ
jgi:plastocyanin